MGINISPTVMPRLAVRHAFFQCDISRLDNLETDERQGA